MSDRDALLAAVLASPDDDLPRLVFADWLEETGLPALAARAQYIRAQAELPTHAPGSDAWLKLNRASADLRDRFRDEWDEEFKNPNEWQGFVAVRRRGFVDEVKTSPGLLAGLGRRMFATAPVRVLRLVGSDAEGWAGFAKLTCLGGVKVLQIGPGVWESVALDTVFANASLSGLCRLELSGNGLDDLAVIGIVWHLSKVAFAGSLAELDLSRNAIGDGGAGALAGELGRLQRLDLRGNRITAKGVAVLRERFGDRVLL